MFARITRQAWVSERVACIGILKFKWTKPIVHQFFQLFVNILNISNYSHITYHEWVSDERRKRFRLPEKKKKKKHIYTRPQANEHKIIWVSIFSIFPLFTSLSLSLSDTNTHSVASKHTENIIISQSRQSFISGKFYFSIVDDDFFFSLRVVASHLALIHSHCESIFSIRLSLLALIFLYYICCRCPFSFENDL